MEQKYTFTADQLLAIAMMNAMAYQVGREFGKSDANKKIASDDLLWKSFFNNIMNDDSENE